MWYQKIMSEIKNWWYSNDINVLLFGFCFFKLLELQSFLQPTHLGNHWPI